ncbi:ubiquinone biosynthesis accessory factor UbiJ [Microbulbifer guangxiensis]|uniref:ubiquinone biosynthesis accessory factor UbiJ n=1 Tax=Microbulbifer guangxiensis TaxID=2904249 RepID=UPI001F2EA8F4|nr:SCP2 sterol-binding domain-containing protein [Microbulbifer guangxiensis]
MDPTFRSGFDAALESAINAALSCDPATRARLGKLDGRALALNLTAPRMELILCVEGEEVRLRQHWEGPVDTRLTGSPIALLRLLRDDSATPAKLGVSITGSSALLQQLQQILRDLDIDWEAPLSRLLGDVPAHSIGKLFRSADRWLRQNLADAPGAAAEAVSEEWQLTPPRAQFEAFADDVAELALATDRLEARLRILRQKLDPREAP